MKISHSIIVLTSVIFVTGSMITVGMDLKRTTNNVSTNVIEAKYKYNQEKDVYLHDAKHEEGMDSASNEEYVDKMNTEKAMLKLKSLNQKSNNRPTNKLL